jgi:hypothetical protein
MAHYENWRVENPQVFALKEEFISDRSVLINTWRYL